jgi:hypothetical protein
MSDVLVLGAATVGAAPQHKGLWFHFGHGHQGFTQGVDHRRPARRGHDQRHTAHPRAVAEPPDVVGPVTLAG